MFSYNVKQQTFKVTEIFNDNQLATCFSSHKRADRTILSDVCSSASSSRLVAVIRRGRSRQVLSR